MRALASSGAGFLLAVLWFDLMFDVQVLRGGAGAERGASVASISAYYRRVTTEARPMNRVVALAMAVTLGTIVAQLARGAGPTWAWSVSFALAAAPMALAAAHTVPSAVRLGSGVDPPERQWALARSILRDHVVCLGCIAGLLGVLLGGS